MMTTNNTADGGADDADRQRVRSWYGLSADIIVEHGLWHLVRIGRISLYHPPVVNLILRRGQPRADRLHLSFLHEFGHLQTLPAPIAHILLLVTAVRWRGRGVWGTLVAVLAAIVAHQALWELTSESYVMVKAGPEYDRIYREHPNPVGQVAFWSSMAALAIFLSGWLMHRENGDTEAP